MLPDVPVLVRCACALAYVILLKLLARGSVVGLEVMRKCPFRFLDECHFGFCCALDSLNRLAAQMGCAGSAWKAPSFF